MDVQHKKRGRPRLREETNTAEVDFGPGNTQGDYYTNQSSIVSIPQLGSRRSKSYREIRSQPDTVFGGSRSRAAEPGHFIHQSPHGKGKLPASPAPSNLSQSTPAVFLTPDFQVAEHNEAFADALGLTCSAKGQYLTDLVISSEIGKIQRLQTAVRAEVMDLSRKGRIHASYENGNGLPAIENLDLGHSTPSFHSRSEYWTFRLPKGRSIGFPITLSLARNGDHFIILTLVQSSNMVMQATPEATQVRESRQLASPPLSQTPGSPSQAGQSSQYHQRNNYSQGSYVYPVELSPPLTSGSESRTLSVQPSPSTSMEQYNNHSPLQTTVLPYCVGGPVSSSESSRTSQSLHHERPVENLRHLQLPPIRTSGKGISEPSRSGDERRAGHSHDKHSPAKGSPQSGRKKKRQRVEIMDMLH